MVGVGGRSRACGNCRRRRIKCDLSKPKCGRCVKARLECGGPRDIAIISFNGRSASNLPLRGPSYESSASEHSNTALVNSRRVGFKLDLELPVHHDDIFTAFTFSHLLPQQDTLGVAPGLITTRSLLALATTYYGIRQQEGAVTRFGFKRYGDALKTIHTSLANPTTLHSFDLLEAIMIMALIEFLISDREDGWINHACGLERLLAMRGPQAMAALPCLRVLERTRPSIIFAAIALHKPTIMSHDEWRSEPWRSHPERADSLKLLYDILAECPELYVLRDKLPLQHDGKGRKAATDLLSQKCHCILNSLETWERRFTTDKFHMANEIAAPLTTPIVTSEYGSSYPAWITVFRYRSLYHANAMTVYYGVLILTLQFLDNIVLDQSSSCSRNLRHERISAAGFNICRSVDYHQDEKWGEQGNFDLLFPLRMAYDAVGRTEPAIGAWIQNVLQNISAGRKGMWRSARTLLAIGSRNMSSKKSIS